MFIQTGNKYKKGYALLEIVIGSAVIAVVFASAAYTINSVRGLNARTTDIIRANYLLLEGADVLKILRDNSWSGNIATLTAGTSYYLVWSSGAWSLSTTPSVIDGQFTRTVTVGPVYRDGNANIANTGSLDTGTVSATSSVSWTYKGTTYTREFHTYITDLYAN